MWSGVVIPLKAATTQICCWVSLTKKAVLARLQLDHCPDSRNRKKKESWRNWSLLAQHFHEKHDIDQEERKDSAVFTAIVLTAIDSDLVRSVRIMATRGWYFSAFLPINKSRSLWRRSHSEYDDTSQYDHNLCKSLFPRYEDGVLVIPKALVKSPISAYENTLEVFFIKKKNVNDLKTKPILFKVESVAALEEIISDPDSMRMQVLHLIMKTYLKTTSATNESLAGLAGTRENLRSSAPRHQLLYPVSGRCLCRHGTLRAMHYLVDVRKPLYWFQLDCLDKRLGYMACVYTYMQVRAGHAAEDPGASLPHDPV